MCVAKFIYHFVSSHLWFQWCTLQPLFHFLHIFETKKSMIISWQTVNRQICDGTLRLRAFHFTRSEFIYLAKDSSTTNGMAGKCTHTHYIKYTPNETEPDTYSFTTLVRGLVILAWRWTCDANNLYEIREKRMNGWVQMEKIPHRPSVQSTRTPIPMPSHSNIGRVFI